MNDPYVERLRYRLQVDTRFIDFDNPSPLVQECSKFRFTLENGLLTVEMKDHCESVEEAKRVIEHELLNDWVISFAIELERDVIKFEFIDADVIDRRPSPAILGQITAKAEIKEEEDILKATGTVSPLRRNEYPLPLSGFKATPDVETMWHRYQNHIEGNEPYQAFGYFCLSLIESWEGGRDESAQKYKIEKKVLNTLGNLTSQNKGAPHEARKRKKGSPTLPLTDAEKKWIRATIKMLICRKGEYDFDPASAHTLIQLTMADLPKL